MLRIYQLMLAEILPAIAAGEERTCAEVARFGEGLTLKQGRLRFTLPALFAFTVARHNRDRGEEERIDDGRDNYERFRKLLFERPPNEFLAGYGLQVGVALADLDPDLVVYKLVPLGEQP